MTEIAKTGTGSDIFHFDPHRPATETWVDEGGNDILAMFHADALFSDISNTADAIKLALFGSVLTIPHDVDGNPSVEILEWHVPLTSYSYGHGRTMATAAHGPSQILYRLGIVSYGGLDMVRLENTSLTSSQIDIELL